MSNDYDVRALILDERDGTITSSIQTLDAEALPVGDVLVRVHYSDLNYKDGMIVKGLGKLVRRYPHVPGIDFSGVVEASQSERFRPGDRVVLTGWRVGEVHWGGYATRARVRAEWLVPLPDGLDLRQAMAIGTAGFTAMLAVMALEEHGLKPDKPGDVLVTGAAGGVGSIAVAILAKCGYRVAASTGRTETHDYLRDLGACTIVGRSELDTPSKAPLGSERWSGAIDNVGGQTLASVLATLSYWASCASVGLAGGVTFTSSVLPFLIRGVNLLGIDSATCPLDRRLAAWARLARDLPLDKLAGMTRVVPLTDVPALAAEILKGEVRGRVVVDVNA
jgi:acrylyl-CoA reductase (NADPH)